MKAYTIISLIGLYITALFLIAQWGKLRGRAFINRHSGIFYALGIAVYCTAWTFYGSIGRAATHGLDFLAIYLGPVISLPLWAIIIRKVSRISKTQHLTSLSDFITARYGRNWALGLVVTLLVVMAITPYLALQIQAISSSANVLLSDIMVDRVNIDIAATVLLMIFTLSYGVRFAFDPEERSGLIAAIGFESAFKMIAAFAGGLILIRSLFGGAGSLYKRALDAGMSNLLVINDPQEWWWMLIISSMTFILLPRQFQMAAVSQKNERDIKTAMWLLPLFLLLMNWWIIPIALGGNLYLPSDSNPDYHFLNLALASNIGFLPGLVFLGGLAASTSMIVVSASALGNMVNANFFIPATLKRREEPAQSINPLLMRRLAIVLIFVLAYLYYTYFVEQRSSLVSIGMISFIGIAQLAPGFFGALFWRKSNSVAVLVGLIGGFLIWLAAFGLPQWTPTDVGQAYVFHIFSTWSPMSNIIFASLFVNTVFMVGLSIVLPMNPLERTQAEIFFNIMNISRDRYDQSPIKTGRITFERLEKMMLRYLPEELLSETLYKRYTIMRVEAAPFAEVPGDLLSYSERLLTQIIGPVAARIVMNREIEEDSINTFDIQDIIQETKATQRLNVALREKTEILERTTAELTMANDQLQAMGSLKDDFLYTVTHELRSPLTAIRAQIEIIRDDQDMPEELQNQFLDAAISECERLTNLITTVLDIEKFESGNQQLSYQSTDLRKLADRTLENMRAWAFSEGISLEIDGPEVAYCDVDEARIQQVLMNLFSNALKYGRERISLRIHQETDAWTICIEDDGPGVPADDVPHLFNKFYQSTDQTVKKRIGTGLGLAISYNIVRSHGGQLELSQNPPEGPTTFCITLPQKTSSL